MRALAAVPVLLVLVGTPGSAQAQGRFDASDGWREHLDARRRVARARMRSGLTHLVRSQTMSERAAPLELRSPEGELEIALARFDDARRGLPRDPELAYYTGHALMVWERPDAEGGTEMRTDDAIAAFLRVRALDPDYRPDRVASALATLYMRRHEFERAAAEYHAALARALPATVSASYYENYPPRRDERFLAGLHATADEALLHGNLAEVLMLTGDVRGAERHYRLALDRTPSTFTRALALWGLALALERAGDHAAAIAEADRALLSDPIAGHPDRVLRRLSQVHGGFAVLHLDGVFFEPPYEIHAYEALGHEAIAGREATGDPEALGEALRSWRLFLAEGGVASRFAPLARQRIEALEARGAEVPARRRAPLDLTPRSIF